jgi:hypothetical protein
MGCSAVRNADVLLCQPLPTCMTRLIATLPDAFPDDLIWLH